MSTTSVLGDASQQVVDVSRSMVRLSWAMTVLGAQQAANMMLPSKIAKSGASLATALNAMASAIEGQFGTGLKSAYRTGSVFAMAPLDGLPSSEVNRAMQGLAMQPVFFEPLKIMMPPLAASMAAFGGHDSDLVRRECEAKMEVMQLVQDVRKICPDKDVYVPLPDLVAKAYALGSFPALWAIEGIGHELVTSRHHRGESLTALLTAKEVGSLPDGSLTMLHAGVGLGLAELALVDLHSDSPAEAIDAALERFVAGCRSSSRDGYLGCALESLGLVTRHFYGHSMVLALDKCLGGKDPALRGFFWHGVGRAVYFSPENLVPGLSSAWPAVAMCERLSPHDVAKDNMIAGVAWGMTMVNLKQPAVLEGFLKKHGQGFGETDAFIDGVTSAMIVRKHTTPEDPYIAALLAHEPATSDARVQALWERVVRQSVSKALNEQFPVLAKKKLLGEVFRFQSLGELAR